MILGQVKVDDKSNEINAIAKLFSRLDIASAIISMNTMGCQKKIVEQFDQQEADYLFKYGRKS